MTALCLSLFACGNSKAEREVKQQADTSKADVVDVVVDALGVLIVPIALGGVLDVLAIVLMVVEQVVVLGAVTMGVLTVRDMECKEER